MCSVKLKNMYGFKFFVSIGVVLVLIFATDNEVMAAPAPDPHPCLWVVDYGHGHTEPTTSTTTTTVKPDLVEDFAKLKDKKTNQFEKYISDLIMWGPSSEIQKPRSINALDKMISGYVKFLAKLLNMF